MGVFSLEKPVQYLKGVGPVRAGQLARLGIFTCGDIVSHFPRDYSRRKKVTIAQLSAHQGETVIISGSIFGTPQELRRRVHVLNAMVQDATGYIRCTWFNQGFVKDKLLPGKEVSLAGKYSVGYGGSIVVEEYSFNEELREIQPLYNLTEGINNQAMTKIAGAALKICKIEEIFPLKFREEYGLLSAAEAVRILHSPREEDSLSFALYTGKFTELFLYQLSFISWRQRKRQRRGYKIQDIPGLKQKMEKVFGFKLYSEQLRAIQEIVEDLKTDVPMNRLLQGDVGSGKTAVAAFALFLSAANGYKAVMMAPTEIVASQHYHSLYRVAKELGLSIHLLTGSTRKKEREAIYDALLAEEGGILIGTHAVFQPHVQIRNLALVITDEQHRFGVLQRMALSGKGNNPHVLAMSATPIPRTLAMTLYGDLDVTTIAHKPPDRIDVFTKIVPESHRQRVFNFLNQELKRGNTGYIICPLIEESEEIDALSLESYEKILAVGLKGYNYGILHGRLTGKEKEEIIADLKAGKLHFILATTVVEVGLDIGNATFIVIENSERYGLAQLHQLRGRVGRRNNIQSYCFLMTDSGDKERLRILEETNDGFAIAMADMQIRGSGQFLGQRQHGLNEFRLADVIKDSSIAKITRGAAVGVLPYLGEPEWETVNGIITKNISTLKS